MNILPPKSLGNKGIQSVLQDLSKRKKITKQPFPNPSEVLDRVAGYLADKGVLRKKSELNKEAIIGPAAEVARFGLPSLAGYLIGRVAEKKRTLDIAHSSKDDDEFRRHLADRISKDTPSAAGRIGKFLLIPGYTGYRLGKGGGRAGAVKKLHKQRVKKEKQLTQEKQARCWEGYEPVPGKAPYTKGSCKPKGEKEEAEKKADTNIPLSPDESYLASQLIGKSLFSALQLAKEQELRKNMLEEKGRDLGGENVLRIPIPQHLLPSQKVANEQLVDPTSTNPGVFARALKLNSHPVKKLIGMQGGFRDAKKDFFLREKEQIEKELMAAQKEYISLLERIKMGEERGEIKKAQETPCVDAFCNGIAYGALFEKDAEELPDLAPEIKDLFVKAASIMKSAQPSDIDIADGSVRRVLGDVLQGVKKPFQPAIDTAAGGLLTTAAGSAYLTYLLRKKMREEPERYMQESLPTKVELQPYR